MQRAVGFHQTHARRIFRGMKSHGERMRYVADLSNRTDISESTLFHILERKP